MKLVKLVTAAAIVILLLMISGAGLAETSGTPTLALSVEGDVIVNSTADSGPGTMRQALLDAQSGDIITFDPAVFSPSTPATIYLTDSLPVISQGNLEIDASNAGVILDGSNIGPDYVPCLIINSDGNIIQGLQIVNFSPGTGIRLEGNAQNNIIGGDRSVGSGPLGQGNLVSRGDQGICLGGDGTSFNTITGNLIGTDASGADDWGNSGSAIWIENGAKNNTIGPNNVIAYNNLGIEIRDSNSLGNTITQNSIHSNKDIEGGIYLQGGNTGLPAPIFLDFDLAAGMVTGFASADCTVEIFSDSSNQGEVYEGQTTADGSGFFSFSKGASLSGPCLTATATDTDGNTSGFATATSGTYRSTSLQENNNLLRTQIQTKESGQLEDNRIGVFTWPLWYPHLDPELFPEGTLNANNILQQGFKRFCFSINELDCDNPYVPIDRNKPELSIEPSHDEFITSLADNGITMTYILSFWDKEYIDKHNDIPIPRFKTEDEIQRYLDFVRFIVRHFKDRIEYYEIWNEPDIKDTIQWIEVEDYINLVKRAVPVIREEYPDAKIVVGGTTGLQNKKSQDYLFTILESDIMPLVDVVSWHPMMGISPEYEENYYYKYPSLVQEIKDVASAHGFTGEYEGDGIHWWTSDSPGPGKYTYSEIKSAKYLLRGIVMHLGMDMTVVQIPIRDNPQLFHANQNVCTIMAGVEPVDLQLEIQREAESGFSCACNHANNVRHYCFSLSNGDRLIALWIDGEAADNFVGINTTVTIPGVSAQRVTGIDVLYGFEQELVTSMEDGNLVIENLLVKDYPIILQLGDYEQGMYIGSTVTKPPFINTHWWVVLLSLVVVGLPIYYLAIRVRLHKRTN